MTNHGEKQGPFRLFSYLRELSDGSFDDVEAYRVFLDDDLLLGSIGSIERNSGATRGRTWEALDRDENSLGAFPSRRAACDALLLYLKG